MEAKTMKAQESRAVDPFSALKSDLERYTAIPEAVRTDITEALKAMEMVKQTRRPNLNEWAYAIHENAVNHGWWEEERSLPELMALFHSEISEGLEQYRSGKPMLYCENMMHKPCGDCTPERYAKCHNAQSKPEGVTVELADCIIRILDYCGRKGINIDRVVELKHHYNMRRAYRHGGKIC
jgi:hypothetical protein